MEVRNHVVTHLISVAIKKRNSVHTNVFLPLCASMYVRALDCIFYQSAQAFLKMTLKLINIFREPVQKTCAHKQKNVEASPVTGFASF
jgi:hypothetical protein